MFHIHKWGKWSEVEEEAWERRYRYSGVVVPVRRETQTRTCDKCGKFQRRYLDE